MDDLISRQVAIQTAERMYKRCDTSSIEDYHDLMIEALTALPSAQPELNRKNLLRTMMAGILATSSKDAYYCGFRNGIRWSRALLEDKEPEYEEALSVQPERKEGSWVLREDLYGSTEAKCSECGWETLVNEPGNGLHEVSDLHFCPNCGARMDGEGNG